MAGIMAPLPGSVSNHVLSRHRRTFRRVREQVPPRGAGARLKARAAGVTDAHRREWSIPILGRLNPDFLNKGGRTGGRLGFLRKGPENAAVPIHYSARVHRAACLP